MAACTGSCCARWSSTCRPTGSPPAATFWAAALLARPRQLAGDHTEFTALDDAAALPFVGLQDVGADAARFHLDLETDDIPAEVSRLEGLGARVVDRRPDWTVLRDPAGLLLCVVPVESPDFAERSRPVG